MHTVQDGQSLWSIAVQYNVKLGDILWLNGFAEDVVLQPGAQVRVRLAPDEAPPPTPTPILYHSVRSGQTLWEVALTYGLTLDELLALNNLDQNAILIPGDQLLVRQAPPTPLPTEPPTATVPAATPTQPSPTVTPTPPSTAVSLQINQPVEQSAETQEVLAETAVSPDSTESTSGVVRLFTWLAVALLVIGFVAIIVLRSELI